MAEELAEIMQARFRAGGEAYVALMRPSFLCFFCVHMLNLHGGVRLDNFLRG